MQNHPIDAVITWVDGSDPELTKKRNAYLEGANTLGGAATRFASMDEIVYCVLSILKYAPFFDNIYIVTDNQTPPIFDVVKERYPEQFDKIKIVDHTEIFVGYEEYLPTFNSSTINMQLHNIPGLAEKFIYFNDDFMLVQSVSSEDFFDGKKPVLRGKWMNRRHYAKLWLKNLPYVLRGLPKSKRRFGGIPLQINSARVAGHKQGVFLAGHVPYPINRQVLADFEKNYPTEFKKNLSHRFRAVSQFVTEALANHLELNKDNAVVSSPGDSNTYIYIDAGKNNLSRIMHRLERADQNENVKFLCIQSLDQAPPKQKKVLVEWLTKRFMDAEHRL